MEKTNVSGVGNRFIKTRRDIFVKQKLVVFLPFCGSMHGKTGFYKKSVAGKKRSWYRQKQ
jgi:hypothetical protein